MNFGTPKLLFLNSNSCANHCVAMKTIRLCKSRRQEGRIEREDIWPTEREIGLPVILAGGEVGILTAWWNDSERRTWRWSTELFNHK